MLTTADGFQDGQATPTNDSSGLAGLASRCHGARRPAIQGLFDTGTAGRAGRSAGGGHRGFARSTAAVSHP